MGSFKDRGGKATLNDAVGAVMDFLCVAGTTGQLGKFSFRGHRHNHDGEQ